MDDKQRAIEALNQLEAISYREPATLSMELVRNAGENAFHSTMQMLAKIQSLSEEQWRTVGTVLGTYQRLLEASLEERQMEQRSVD